MHKLLARQLANAAKNSGEIDLPALAALVSAAYEQSDADRQRTDRSISLMVAELEKLNRGLDQLVQERTAELRERECELQAQNLRFDAALENMPHGLCMFDRNERLIVCNRRYGELYGLSPEQAKPGVTLAELRSALANDEFVLHYHPIVDINTREAASVEALIRWQHPQRGLISPLEFIPLAEETGLINPIGEWVLRKACADAALWPANVKVSVNLSAVQFRRICPIENFRHVLDESGLPAERLELEITETVLLQGSDENVETLHQLRRMGISIVLDDFGTGYSSLSYLRKFPFDKIKIDRSFVHELANNEHSASIVSAVAGLGRSLRIGTVAEGIETEEQLVLVRAAGCTHAQGYLFGNPCPAAELKFRRFEQRKTTKVA